MENSTQVKVGGQEDSVKDQEEDEQDAASIRSGKCQGKKRNHCQIDENQEDTDMHNKVSKQGTNSTQGESSLMQMTGLTDIYTYPLSGGSSGSEFMT